MEMILKAREKELERLAWELWLTFDQETKNETPFKEFLKKIKQPTVHSQDTRSDEEVLKDAENILKSIKRSE
jgi:hypothetical protein